MSTLLKSNCNAFRPFELIQRAHNYVVGHHGVQVYWIGVRFEGMRASMKQSIEFRLCCQKMSRISPEIQATPFKMATYRFGERFDMPKDDYENEYFFVIVDAFSRFVKLTPFACPRIIHSDRRTQFLNDIITCAEKPKSLLL
jgi:hypothetical protein